VVDDASPASLPPRLRRALELVYAIEGVTAARIWHWDDRIAIGVRGASAGAQQELLRKVEAAIAPLREPGERWELGVLDDA
jgi:hypothetical protein